MYTNTNMTIFNKNVHNGQVIYIPKLIDYVFWNSQESINNSNKNSDGADKSDEVVVYMPVTKNDMTNYKEPKEYIKSFTGWTIREGDFIVKGDLTKKNNEDNIINGIKDLKDYEVFSINLVDYNDFGSNNMKHFKIKGN